MMRKLDQNFELFIQNCPIEGFHFVIISQTCFTSGCAKFICSQFIFLEFHLGIMIMLEVLILFKF